MSSKAYEKEAHPPLSDYEVAWLHTVVYTTSVCVCVREAERETEAYSDTEDKDKVLW